MRDTRTEPKGGNHTPPESAPPPPQTHIPQTQGPYEEQEVYPHTPGSNKRRKHQKVWVKKRKFTCQGPLLMETQANRGANAPTKQRGNHPLLLLSYSIGCRRRGKCGHRQSTHREQKAANTAERNMSGTREYLMGSPSGKK